MKPSIYDLTQPQLVDWFVKNGEKKFRATQVWQWLYEKRVTDFSEMSNLSKQTIELLQENFVLDPLKEVVVQVGDDGTIKYLFELPDHHMIETVLMRQAYGLSVCVTTQIGCNIGCTFCASGLLKKQRNLTTGEIVAQIMKVQHYLDKQGKDERVSHIVVMGIGEPFDNYNNVMKFLHIMNDPKGLKIGARHMTVSTSGLVPKIKEFATNGLQVNLAISLHAPNNETRTSIMQINRAYPIERLMDAVDYYLKETNRRITFEYIMLQGVNDTAEHAQQLADLLKDKKKLTYVNLIPYNIVEEHNLYQRSTKKDTLAFYDILKKNGINCVVRQEFGSDIDAACGQLRSKQMKKDKQQA